MRIVAGTDLTWVADSGQEPSPESRRRTRRGVAPWTPSLGSARCHSLVLAVVPHLFQSLGYYGAHLRALI